MTIVATALSITSLLIVPYSDLRLSLASSVFAIGSGFISLKIVHQNQRTFKGAAVLISCIIIASIVLAAYLVMCSLFYSLVE